MASEVKVNKLWPRAYTTAYIELKDGKIEIFPTLAVDQIICVNGTQVDIEGWDLSVYVDLSSDQTIDGTKTFVHIPVLPASDPTTINQAVRKKYVDDINTALTAAIAGIVTLPPGSIIPYAAETPPNGFLLCDGSDVSRAVYADLFNVIQTTFGYGSGTTFRVPNLKGRVIVGWDSSVSPDTSFDNVGDSGGEKYHSLTIAEIPSHTHGYIYPTYQGVSAIIGGEGSCMVADWDDTNPTGGSGSHNNLQPYMVFNYIIKT